MKLYDLVFGLLTKVPEYRVSDKDLIWAVWERQGIISGSGHLSYIDFVRRAKSPESIRRCRQKIQELNPDLRSTNEKVNEYRAEIQKQKGTHVFRDMVTGEVHVW